MEISKDPLDDEIRYAIRGYGPGEIRINQTVYAHSLILTRNSLDADWNPPPLSEWTPAVLDPLLAHDPEILLIGTGARLHLLGTAFLAHALRQGVGLETMDTAAACRTFNILVSEGRRVAAGLIVE
ncbi:MAG TPA: Mth938-like domain-containing protein [Gammaproteobacteria bacterium]